MFVERLFPLLMLLALALPARAALEIQNWNLARGGAVYFVENHDLPMIDVSVDFSAGSARDQRATSGLAAMTNRMLVLGAGDLSEQRISEQLADAGATLNGRFDQDRAGYVLRSLSSPAEKGMALAILRRVLAEPRFDPAILEREIRRASAEIQDAAAKPEYQGEKAFQTAIYGEHPYALPEDGEIDTLAKLGVEDVRAFHRRYYVAPNMVIAIMGDMSRAEAEAFAASIADALPAGVAPPALPPVRDPPQAREITLPHHASQSHLFIGMPGMKRVDPDYFPLLVGNYILGGGGFDSRIMAEIRQKRGLAYSAYSYFMPLEERGPFRLGLQTRRESTNEALEVSRATLKRFLDEGPSESELLQARNNLVGGFPLRLDSNKKIHDHLALIGFYHLPLDWLERYPRAVEAVTRDDVVRAFRARVKPESMVTVIVGGQIGATTK
jgi:zinc protease